MNSNSPTYEHSQILAGVRVYWRSQFGKRAYFGVTARIDQSLNAGGFWRELDIYDVIRGIDNFFSIGPKQVPNWHQQAFPLWQKFFGTDIKDPQVWEEAVGRQLTFGRLADFLRSRVRRISF